jgi:hypothetical protein
MKKAVALRAKRRKLSSATSWPLLLPTAWKEIVEDSQTFGLTELMLWPPEAARKKLSLHRKRFCGLRPYRKLTQLLLVAASEKLRDVGSR